MSKRYRSLADALFYERTRDLLKIEEAMGLLHRGLTVQAYNVLDKYWHSARVFDESNKCATCGSPLIEEDA